MISRQLLRQLILCWVRLSGGACITRVGNVGDKFSPDSACNSLAGQGCAGLIKVQNMLSYVELL